MSDPLRTPVESEWSVCKRVNVCRAVRLSPAAISLFRKAKVAQDDFQYVRMTDAAFEGVGVSVSVGTGPGVAAGQSAARHSRRLSAAMDREPGFHPPVIDGGGGSGGDGSGPPADQRAARRAALIRDIDERLDSNYTSVNLRRLFRAFDTDHDNVIKHTELQQGLLALGMVEASHPSVVNRLLAEMDVSKTGEISELEFIEYFKRIRRSEIRERLHKYAAKNDVRVTAVDYGGCGVACRDGDVG